jgi:hypothetical protein
MVLVLRSIYFSGFALRCRFTPTLLDFSIRIATTRDVRDSFLMDDISSRLQMLWNYPSICLNLHKDICADGEDRSKHLLSRKIVFVC